jgi:hypothetical protein
MKNMRSVRGQASRKSEKDCDKARHRAVQIIGALIDSTKNVEAIVESEYNLWLGIAKRSQVRFTAKSAASRLFQRLQEAHRRR